ncbi:hypothetical protein ABZW30_18465 [Kitasatospora sp. NPDC004669]|uniref:hypothetical protein n=1 Tax=Kitasatospora sp. NPDC004669 TaxID=3154555 RepID=UPI0033B75D3D
MDVSELLARKEAEAKRNADLWESLFGKGAQVLLTLLAPAGWIWTLYLAFFTSCDAHYEWSHCNDQLGDTVRVGVVTALVTFLWLWQASARRIRRLEDELAERG